MLSIQILPHVISTSFLEHQAARIKKHDEMLLRIIQSIYFNPLVPYYIAAEGAFMTLNSLIARTTWYHHLN